MRIPCTKLDMLNLIQHGPLAKYALTGVFNSVQSYTPRHGGVKATWTYMRGLPYSVADSKRHAPPHRVTDLGGPLELNEVSTVLNFCLLSVTVPWPTSARKQPNI